VAAPVIGAACRQTVPAAVTVTSAGPPPGAGFFGAR